MAASVSSVAAGAGPLELKSLRYFVAVAEAESLGKAALVLNMAQPPLSVQIRLLEQRVGTALFLRSARGMRLTEAGAALFARAREALALAREGIDEARAVAAGRRGHLAIGYMFALGYQLLPRLAPALRRALPDVDLRFVEMSANSSQQLLLDHQVALAICMPTIRHDAIRSEHLGTQPLRLAVPTSSPLARLRSVPLARLQGERLIALPAGQGGTEASTVQGLLRRHRITMPVAHRVETVHAALALVLAGEGVALLPACVAAMGPKHVVLKPLQRVSDGLDVGLCWRKDAHIAQRATVMEAIRQSIGPPPAGPDERPTMGRSRSGA